MGSYSRIKNKKQSLGKRGVLLLEVLISVGILAVVLTVIIQAMAGSLKTTVASQEYVTGVLLAENKMFDVFLEHAKNGQLESEADFDEPFKEFHYQIKNDPEICFKQDGSAPRLQGIHLNVEWPKNNLEIVTCLLLPEKSAQ